ncbi:N-glycosylase/DNA lyase [Peptoclostridium acidaminophilum DSM 3953]|uniref:DNA-(apurinic or apyrimidinic site) lyase n=1 Tax=Peptoclostridium acidaminophilum DSM 3953 TaxID=1286171 RepID=W8T5M2_PEPAC|nr:DNA glycosylase [Peptoclostridium acidaminophilum]AHM57049.1 N-glycosylase/DNA lyase [Peptoclostridium acidaminophilum DSM 3953]
MELKIYEEKKGIIVSGLNDFEPRHIFECGQCFRWDREEDGSYTGVAHSRVLNVKKEGDIVIFNNTSRSDFEGIWMDYFDIGRDYSAIKEKLRKLDEHLERSVEFGYGIRLLKQDVWETTVSFIISANNAIPKIKKTIDTLSYLANEEIIEYGGRKFYAFPSPETIHMFHEKCVDNCKAGYRAQYIKDSCSMIINRDVDLERLAEFGSHECRKELMRLPGVGPKVADCIMLFALQKFDAFPVDVWVKRVISSLYNQEDMSLNKMREFALGRFGDLAGFAQQYLFYYARENGVGRK